MSALVLHVLPWISSGGVEKRRVQIVSGLGDYEHRVVCKTATQMWRPHLEAAGAEVTEIGGSWDVFDVDTVARLLSIIETWRPTIIHGAVFEGVVMAALAGYLGEVPRVIIEETGVGHHRRARPAAEVVAIPQLAAVGAAPADHPGAGLEDHLEATVAGQVGDARRRAGGPLRGLAPQQLIAAVDPHATTGEVADPLERR